MGQTDGRTPYSYSCTDLAPHTMRAVSTSSVLHRTSAGNFKRTVVTVSPLRKLKVYIWFLLHVLLIYSKYFYLGTLLRETFLLANSNNTVFKNIIETVLKTTEMS